MVQVRQIYRWRSFYYIILMNPWLITLLGEINFIKQVHISHTVRMLHLWTWFLPIATAMKTR